MKNKIILNKSLQLLYLTNRHYLPENRKHKIWQSPLLLPNNLSDLDEINKRLRHAGELWLQNHDFSCFNTLVITHTKAKISYLFQRTQKPNDQPTLIGPIPQNILKNGKIFFHYTLFFLETNKIIDL